MKVVLLFITCALLALLITWGIESNVAKFIYNSTATSAPKFEVGSIVHTNFDNMRGLVTWSYCSRQIGCHYDVRFSSDKEEIRFKERELRQ